RFQELLSVGGQIYYETHYGPMLEMQGEAREVALEVVRSDGRRLPALVNSVVRRDESGRTAFVRTAVFDATDRRAYERELLDARRRAEESEARARLLARTLQQSLLPPAVPEIPGLDVGAAFRPAGAGDEVGGDFYDVFETRAGGWAVAVGDVRGKGAEAAAVTALARYTVRAGAFRDVQPARVLADLNDVLLRERGDWSCTVAIGSLTPRDGCGWRVTVACGGHPPPLRIGPSSPARPVGRPGTLLGLLDTIDVADVEEALAPGEAVVFFTDGVTEARGPEGFFGEERLAGLLDTLRDAGAVEIARGVVDRVVEFQAGDPRDDIAVVVVRVPPER
ncbi:MAG: PP2C family protein-serine/threonine phosphatase, partial [Actinomycetes bacterium]